MLKKIGLLVISISVFVCVKDLSKLKNIQKDKSNIQKEELTKKQIEEKNSNNEVLKEDESIQSSKLQKNKFVSDFFEGETTKTDPTPEEIEDVPETKGINKKEEKEILTNIDKDLKNKLKKGEVVVFSSEEKKSKVLNKKEVEELLKKKKLEKIKFDEIQKLKKENKKTPDSDSSNIERALAFVGMGIVYIIIGVLVIGTAPISGPILIVAGGLFTLAGGIYLLWKRFKKPKK